MRNQSGFSLAEMVVAIALIGILGMVISSFMVFAEKSKNEITNEIEDKVDNILAERMILRDLKSSEPSFNNVLIRDDQGRRFFDYITDRAEQGVDLSARTLTLQAGVRNEFTFLTVNTRLGGTIMYTPSMAYNVGNPPMDPYQEAELTFHSLNKGGEITKVNSKYWQPGVLLMLDSPALVREMTPTGLNYNRPARSPIFVGAVTGVGETRLRPLNLPNFLDLTHPLYPNETVTSEDKFLRDVPPMGGAAPLVRLKAVTIVKYYLEKDVTNKYNLKRAVFDGSQFSMGQLFAQDIQKVIFTRKDPYDAVIYFNIVRKKD